MKADRDEEAVEMMPIMNSNALSHYKAREGEKAGGNEEDKGRKRLGRRCRRQKEVGKENETE